MEEKRKREANMTEVAFAKSFLTTLDSKPTKYQADHVFDVASIGTRTPVGSWKWEIHELPVLTK